MNVAGGVYKIVLDSGGAGSHLQLEVGQACQFSVESSGQAEMEEGPELGETVEMLPIHHPSSQEITYIQADWGHSRSMIQMLLTPALNCVFEA